MVSTSIADVVRPYGARGLVRIADALADFVAAAEAELDRRDRGRWLAEVDEFLAGNSWDSTWREMSTLIDAVFTQERRCSTF